MYFKHKYVIFGNTIFENASRLYILFINLFCINISNTCKYILLANVKH